MMLFIKKLSDDARIDLPAHDGDAGYDVCSPADYILKPYQITIIPLKIALEFPNGIVCVMSDKSGRVANSNFTVHGNIIDSSYRGEIRAMLFNCSDIPIQINKGEKLVQLVFIPFYVLSIKEVEVLSGTTRGQGGLGSTGLT